MNQRRRLLNLARKGDPKAINRLFELYQVRVYSGDSLSKAKRLPTLPTMHEKSGKAPARKRVSLEIISYIATSCGQKTRPKNRPIGNIHRRSPGFEV